MASSVASHSSSSGNSIPRMVRADTHHGSEKVARLHLAKIGVVLDELTDAQSQYLGISKEGPFKSDLYRY